MAVINRLPVGGGLDPDDFALLYGKSVKTYTTSEAYSNVLVQLGIGGSSNRQDLTYSVNPDKVIVFKHHNGDYWGTWFWYEYLPAGATFSIGNSGGYTFLTIVKLAD